MDSHLDQAPPQQRQKQKPQKETAPMPTLGLHRVEPRPVATHPPSPPRRPILWREAPKLWRDEKPPKKKKKKENEAAAISAREMAGAKINQKELVHFIQFLLCQLRWQAGKIVDESFEALITRCAASILSLQTTSPPAPHSWRSSSTGRRRAIGGCPGTP